MYTYEYIYIYIHTPTRPTRHFTWRVTHAIYNIVLGIQFEFFSRSSKSKQNPWLYRRVHNNNTHFFPRNNFRIYAYMDGLNLKVLLSNTRAYFLADRIFISSIQVFILIYTINVYDVHSIYYTYNYNMYSMYRYYTTICIY